MRLHHVLVLMPVLMGGSVCAQPADLLLYAPFDRSADAAIARGSAQNQGATGLAFVDGVRGQAVVLSDDCRYEVAGNFGAQEGTIGVWLRPHWQGSDPTARTLFCLYGRRDLAHSWAVNRWTIDCSAGRCRFTVFSATAGKTFSVAAPIGDWEPGKWHHVAATWHGIGTGRPDGELKLYLDGTPRGSLSGKQIDVGPTDALMAAGRDQDGSPDYIQADLDDLFIYGRALSPAEIRAGVAAVIAGAPDEIPAVAEVTRAVPGWWDTAWPLRAEVTLPHTDAARNDAFVQCPLRLAGDVSALGVAGVVDEASVRVLAGQGGPLPARVLDGTIEWQAPGSTPAGSERKFWLYFRTGHYIVTQPLVSQHAATGARAPAPPAAAPDYATVTYGKPWDFDDGTFAGIDQWGNKPEYLRDRRVEGGVLKMEVSQDPWFIWGDMWGQVAATRSKVAIDLERFPVLELRVRQSVERANWELYGRPGTGTSLLHHEFPVIGTGWQRVRIDLRQEARWDGVLSAFRIDPTRDVNAHVEIDWVRLVALTAVQHGRVECIGNPSAVAARVALRAPRSPLVAGSASDIAATVTDEAGKPVSGQALRVELGPGSGGRLERSDATPTLALGPRARRGLTDGAGRLVVRYVASERAASPADTLVARTEFVTVPEAQVAVATVAGVPHHYRVEPAAVCALPATRLPLGVSAQLVDQFDNPVAGVRALTWSTEQPGVVFEAGAALDESGCARARWRGEESQRWVYSVTVKDGQGLTGRSAAICLLPTHPRSDPIVLGPTGYFRTGRDGPAWLPLGGFYANWVGLPEGGEEGRRLVSFVDATEEQLDHWLGYLAGQGVTALRFMLRAHTPRGMEPMDVIGRVNMPLFARVLRYMDMARKYHLRFMLTIHEDYTKPAYYNRQALETFCLPQYAGEDLDRLPAYQARFVRDRRLIRTIDQKYTDPDVIACQDRYTRELVGLLKDNPQLFAWEFENEMVDCPREWADHMAGVIRAADPVTPICASHGGGGLHTADPLWWTHKTKIDFYTYHLYSHLGSTSPAIDYGAAVDVLTCYGRMAGVCMLGESAGDEFSAYPRERNADRRYLMRDIIWFSLVNGNPGCFFWNARGIEIEQFRLARKITAGLNWATWQRRKPSLGVTVTHPWETDKFYRTPEGLAAYAMMGRYAQHFLTAGVDFDFTLGPEGYAKTASLDAFAPPGGGDVLRVGPGWQLRANIREGGREGLAYVRNFGGIRHWQAPRVDMYVRERKPAPLVVHLALPGPGLSVTATDLDTGQERTFTITQQGDLDLGVTDHDWAVVWHPAR